MKNKALQSLYQQYPHALIVKKLSPYITDKRKERIEEVLCRRLSEITVAIECPSDINNALAIVRSAEVFGITTVHLIAPEHEAVAARAITQGAFYWVNVQFHQSLTDFIQVIRQTTIRLVGAVVDTNKTLGSLTVETPICLLLGNEARGLSDEAKAACDGFYTIPMCGMTESLNLSVSAAVSLYDLTERKRMALGKHSDLSNTKQMAIRAQYYLNSVSTRLATNLIEGNTQNRSSESLPPENKI